MKNKKILEKMRANLRNNETKGKHPREERKQKQTRREQRQDLNSCCFPSEEKHKTKTKFKDKTKLEIM